MRVRLFGVLAIAVLPLFAAPMPAAEPTPPKPLVTKVFSVAELVIPIPDFALPAQEPARNAPTLADNAEKLVKMVTSLVRPSSWDIRGGAGKAEFFDIGCTLVVTNTAEVVEEVAKLLESLSQLQDTSIVTEVRVLKMPAWACEKLGLKTRDVALTEQELAGLLEVVQQCSSASVMQAPKVTTFDGQTATIRSGERKFFVTGIEAMKVKGDTVFVPQNKPVDLGDTLTMCARVSADGKFVNLRANYTRTRLVSEKVELVPVVTQVTPIFEGGSQGTPIPFTQYLQTPELKTNKAEKTAVVPISGTVVLGSWTEPGESPFGPPKGYHPYVYRLFKNPSVSPMCDVVVLATVRVIHSEAPAAEVAPMPRQVVASVHQLRNVAAADAAEAVQKFLAAKGQKAAVVAEPVSNTVLVSAEPELREQVVKLLTSLDATPPQVRLEAMVVQVPAGFLSDIGLNDPSQLSLAPREHSMFLAALRKEKGSGNIDVLSRPQLSVADNQKGFVRVGGPTEIPAGVEIVDGANGPVLSFKKMKVETGLTLSVTPRISPNSESVMLRVDVGWVEISPATVKMPFTIPPEVTGLKKPITFPCEVAAANCQELQTTAQLKDGNTVIIRGLVSGGGDAQKREVLVILTPHVVRPEGGVKPVSHAEPVSPLIPASAPSAAVTPAAVPAPVLPPQPASDPRR